MLRVGVLASGVENLGEHVIPPSQRLYIATRRRPKGA
jgi:hypothetical protein